jgi:hypothetical protein
LGLVLMGVLLTAGAGACGGSPVTSGFGGQHPVGGGGAGGGSSTMGGSSSAGGTGSTTTTSAAGSTTGGSGAGGSTTSSSTSTTPPDPAFQLEAHTVVAPDNALALITNLPATVEDCAAAPFTGTPCGDLDQDGLADAWEEVVIDRFRPLLRLDEQESLVSDASAVVANVARVAVVTKAPLHVRALIMIGYSKDYGSCGFTSHNGDSERVAVDLVATAGGGPGDVTQAGAYTAAHENTANDHSKKFLGADLAQLVRVNDAQSGEPRWVVYPSQDKHGTYATIAICENISIIPCFDEDCAPDGVADPSKFDRLPPFVNAGEEVAPLVTDLTAIGFPGDDAWAKKDFCGGLGGATCSAPVRDKLLVDPF